ncbi:MAG: 50S ribosomal protein L35 [Patescibacteria group bacterium]|nr:50S ribosomal protein L35 [Patescibacteria group bacterium]
MKSKLTTMAKIRKSFLKRFRITARGKILRRTRGQSHSFVKKETEHLLRRKRLKLANKLVLEYKNY